jgi:hypothetical protein
MQYYLEAEAAEDAKVGRSQVVGGIPCHEEPLKRVYVEKRT